MVSESLDFYAKGCKATGRLVATRIWQRLQALVHRWTYRQVAHQKNVVVLGGSYAGVYLAQRLTETLPTGYRAVLVERNSHFQHLFAFPRFGVIKGHERKAFVPYDNLARGAPSGIFHQVRDSATEIRRAAIQLASGDTLDYEYLAVATGSWQPPPAKVKSTAKDEACAELQASQNRIDNADRIAIIGGGPVGIQIASDIKSYFPQKDVTLVHSRKQLLPQFGPKLHQYAQAGLAQLHVNTILGERPQIEDGQRLQFQDGKKKNYDLVISCTGQKPNSAILAALVPAAICKETRQILVRPTLQIDAGSDRSYSHIFALGDVAKTMGPRMARAGRSQADVVVDNILALIREEEASVRYQPSDDDGVIKLTMGKNDWAWYVRDGERELMVTGHSQSDELDVKKAWHSLSAGGDMSA